MLQVNLVNGDVVRVRWQHTPRKRGGMKTTCYVELENDGNVIETSENYARNGHGDAFVKETGRKLSMTRALAPMSLSKQDRADVWEAYRTMGTYLKW